MKLFVTGYKGQLGCEIRELTNDFNAEFAFHDLDTLDISDKSKVLETVEEFNPDFIINCAAYTNVDRAEEEEKLAKTVNADAVKNLTEAAKKCNSYIVHISTDYVFDGSKNIPYKEEETPNPVTAYGRTKLEGEKNALVHEKSLVIRTSWLYSSYGNNFVKTMLKLGEERDSLDVIYDQAGTPTYAADLATSILHICRDLFYSQKKINEVYHFSNEGVCSWYDFSKRIMSIADIDCTINPIETSQFPTPAKRPAYSVMNKSKIKERFGLNIAHWEESLVECLTKILTR